MKFQIVVTTVDGAIYKSVIREMDCTLEEFNAQLEPLKELDIFQMETEDGPFMMWRGAIESVEVIESE